MSETELCRQSCFQWSLKFIAMVKASFFVALLLYNWSQDYCTVGVSCFGLILTDLLVLNKKGKGHVLGGEYV